jgi:hypothetical protein
MRLSTGVVLAGYYDDKVRRVLFAALRNKVPKEEIVGAASELNKVVFEKLQELKVGPRDAVRIKIDYQIKNGQIQWDYSTLEVEPFYHKDHELLVKALEEGETSREELRYKVDAITRKVEGLNQQLNQLSETPLNKVLEQVAMLKQKVNEIQGLLKEISEEHA